MVFGDSENYVISVCLLYCQVGNKSCFHRHNDWENKVNGKLLSGLFVSFNMPQISTCKHTHTYTCVHVNTYSHKHTYARIKAYINEDTQTVLWPYQYIISRHYVHSLRTVKQIWFWWKSLWTMNGINITSNSLTSGLTSNRSSSCLIVFRSNKWGIGG